MSLLSVSRKILGRDTSSPKKKTVAKKGTPAKPAKKSKKTKVQSAAILAGKLNLHMVITEKSLRLHDQDTVVVKVHPRATKHQIMQAVAEKYGVTPVSVRSLHGQPRRRNRGGVVGFASAYKKAYVKVSDINKLQEV